MAYLRIEKKKSGSYMRIVSSCRENGKVKQKTLYSLGRQEDYTDQQLINFGKKFLELAGCQQTEEKIKESFQEVKRVNYGYSLMINRLFKVFNIDKLIKRLKLRLRVKYQWENVLKLMLIERINEPVSKRQNYIHQQEYFGLGEDKNIEQFYRTIDILSENEEKIKEHLFEQQRTLFSDVLDVVFYDVTTLYFASQVEQTNQLRQKGYSKDGKHQKTQIVLGLLIDKLRNPITYHIYSGNTSETKTMIDALKDLKEKYSIDKVIFVADSGMITKTNAKAIIECGFEYILGERLRVLPVKLKERLLDRSQYKSVSSDKSATDFGYTKIEYQGRQIICTYSSKRAAHDLNQREKLIKKAKQMIEKPSTIKRKRKQGAERFIKTIKEKKGKNIYQLNETKIEQDKQYDGFKAICTTLNNPPAEILSHYRSLFEIEQTFRTLKSDLRMRPIFHWTDNRITGHIAMCFIAYTFFNYLKNITQLQLSQITEALDKMQLSVINDSTADGYVYLRSHISEDQSVMIKKLKLVVPTDLTPQSTINQYFGL